MQGECWFQQRNSVIQTEENPCFDSSEILRERLRTLEQTASVMARASIHKGDQKSINRQPDYEFFLSRRRQPLSQVCTTLSVVSACLLINADQSNTNTTKNLIWSRSHRRPLLSFSCTVSVYEFVLGSFLCFCMLKLQKHCCN